MTTIVHPDAEVLAAATAARLVTRLADIQADGRVPGIALTGGGVGIETLRHVAVSPARRAVDWRRVDIYWGDERFVAAESDDRNEKQARDALLGLVDADPARVHAMSATDGEFGDDVDAAAAAYAEVMARRSRPLDVVMLGMGPEGHVASVFPHSAAGASTESVVAVRECPKPPPTRISLTLPTIRSAEEVWLMVAGEAKADAVAQAQQGASARDIPAAGATGQRHTLWLVDEAAASLLPAGRRAS